MRYTGLSLRLRILLSVVVSILAASGLAACGPDDWSVTWEARETLNEWLSLQVPTGSNDRFQVADAPVEKNLKAFRVEVRDNDQAVNSAGQPIPGGWRAEALGPTEEGPTEEAVRYRWSTLLAVSYPTNPVDTTGEPVWQVITQWHQGDADIGSSPPIAFIIEGDEILLHVHQSDCGAAQSTEVGKYRVAEGLDRGNWHDFVMEVRWALQGGSVKVWHNDELVQDLTNIQTLFPTRASCADGNAVAGTVYLKMGLYRKAAPVGEPFVLYHDEVDRSERAS